MEDGEILSDDKRIRKCFKEYLEIITDTLNIVVYDTVGDSNTAHRLGKTNAVPPSKLNGPHFR